MLQRRTRSRRWRWVASGLRAGALFLVTATPFPSAAQTVLSAPTAFGPARVYKEVRTVFDMRWHRLVRQTRDVSCAAASLATLRTYYFRQRSTEEEVLRDLFQITVAAGTSQQAQQFGFSMLDMKRYFESKGFEAMGFAADPESLSNLPIPVIVLVEIRGFPHYVVLKGVRDGVVYMADPLFGNISMRLSSFTQSWEGVFLAAIRKGKPLPVFNPLSVTEEDRISVDNEDVRRLSARGPVPFEVLRLPNVLHISVLPFAPIPGIQSVVPAILTNHVDFKGWGG